MSHRTQILAGFACLFSGVSLVVHILTGSPLWLVLTVVGFIGALTVAISAVNEGAFRVLLGVVARGAVVGVVGTVAYDLSRWLLVQFAGMESSPFAALPLFGAALIGDAQSTGLVRAAGIAYHVVNGVMFGVAYYVWFARRPWWWGVAYAMGLEAFMLALYPGWLAPESIAELTQISLLGHVAYGIALGAVATVLYRASNDKPEAPR